MKPSSSAFGKDAALASTSPDILFEASAMSAMPEDDQQHPLVIASSVHVCDLSITALHGCRCRRPF